MSLPENNGLLTATGFDYVVSQISGGKETVIDENHKDISLDAGESIGVTVSWKIPENLSDTSIRVSISETGVDQKKSVVLERKVPYESKVQFTGSEVLWNGTEPYVKAVVKNKGNIASEECQGVLSKLKTVEKDGNSYMDEEKTYAAFTVPALASGEEETIKIPFSPAVSDYSTLGIIDLKLEAMSDEESIADAYTQLTATGPVCAEINDGEESISLLAGNKITLQAKAAPWNEIAGSRSFYSTDMNVAVVDEKGTVTGIQDGKAEIYVYYPNYGVASSIEVSVKGENPESSPSATAGSESPAPSPSVTAGSESPAPAPSVTAGNESPMPFSVTGTDKITLAKKNLTVAPGKTKSISFTAVPSAGAGGHAAVTVSVSGNKHIKAKISGSKVKVTANKKAEKGSSATVTLKSKNASAKTVKAELKVRVQNKVKKAVLVQKSLTVKKGKTGKLAIKITAENQKQPTTDCVKLSSSLAGIVKTSVKKKKITVSLKGKKKGKKKVVIRVGSKKVKIMLAVR